MENWIHQCFQGFDDHMALWRRIYGLEASRDSRLNYEKISAQLEALLRKQGEQFQQLLDDCGRIFTDATRADKSGKGEER